MPTVIGSFAAVKIVARRSTPQIAALIVLTCLCTMTTWAQTADLSGTVSDTTNAVVPNASFKLINPATGVSRSTQSNAAGVYSFANIQPGFYDISVSADGFQSQTRTGVKLDVEQRARIDFVLKVGNRTESVTVEGGAPLVNTQDGTVSTVVDRQFVENMPLNGRSFQSLILLTPGVVNGTTQGASTGSLAGKSGEFNANGQRDDANYYTVDGVSANVGSYHYGYGTPGTSGSLPVESALGTTQNLVPLDDLQEFRIDTSTYSAQFGRSPGAQMIFETRSGTNQFHGDIYDYLRNTVFDANNWFNDHYGLPNPGERQNDLGGALGGPVEIPHIYNGKNKTFFFFSYEGVRLGLPMPATVTYVPDNALRASAPAALQPTLNAFPIQNGPEAGNGLAEFIGTGTAPSRLDSSSIRLDENLSPKLHMFFRFASTSSNAVTFASGYGSSFDVQDAIFQNTRTYTFGADSTLSSSVSNGLRFNYSHNLGGNEFRPIAFGGSVPVNMAAGNGVQNMSNYITVFALAFGSTIAVVDQSRLTNPQSAWNLVDTLSWIHGRHQLKFGVDYRQTLPTLTGYGNPSLTMIYLSKASLIANVGSSTIQVNQTVYPVFVNSSLFAQDDWQVAPRLTLNMGLRWEADPAPGNHNHTGTYVLQNTGSITNTAVSSYGAPLYDTAWFNFAPRLGIAYLLRSSPGWTTVVRGGVGVFFDTGQQIAGSIYGNGQPGYGAQRVASAPWPFTTAEVSSVPISNPPTPPYGVFYAFPQHLQLPYTLEYNVSLQQAFGNSQAVTLSYVGSHAARLTGYHQNSVRSLNPQFSTIDYVTSGFTSDYNSLQLQYQRRMSRGLQALASYTFSHCIDYSSADWYNNLVVPQRGNCDYDVQHNFSAAFSYNAPNVQGNAFVRAFLDHWGIDDRFTARTGFPITLFGNLFTNPTTGQLLYGQLNTVPGQPYWLYGSQYPGGREMNPAAFTPPPAGVSGDAPRNVLRAFGAWQMDLAVRREFPIYERLNLQFRAEAFNVFNHPNFGTIYTHYCAAGPACQFGQATATLNQSLGALSPLYQMGGPRSLQLSLRLSF